MVRRVAIVGAGSSGLVCMKICIDEGLEPVCFESGDDIGGLWNFRESPEPERSSIYRSLVVNTSKEIMCFSDFPMPDDYPNYMHNSQLLQYFRLYAEHFHLLRYIHFQTTVTSVQQRQDFSLSGQWEVATISRNGDEERHIFDAVMVCSGHYTHPALPLTDFQGHETFSGQLLHSWDYKDADAYRGKRVVVVGIGNSGGDVAAEISRSAEKTFLSTRQGAWVIGRMAGNGLPLDMVGITRFNNLLMQLLPKTLVNWVVEGALNNKYDHRLYGLKPKHRALERRPLINDDLPGRILQGALVMKPNIREFKKSGVIFEDGTIEETIDAVIFCTGYNVTFSFLPSAMSDGPGGELMLFKRLFPPSLRHPTLAIMGLFQAKGPIMPIVEMQARWAVKVFTGLSHLPSKEKMLEVIESERRSNMQSYPCPRQAAQQVDFISYLDFMAKEVGAKPSILQLLLRDPVLWVKVFFGPCTPYQYRLSGPGQWAGARHAILTQWDRVTKPFRTRVVPEPEATRKKSESEFRLTPPTAEQQTTPRKALPFFKPRKSRSMTRRVAVVGGGSSGLACIKSCLDEGLEPVCFESSDDVGGLWRFKENPEPDRASIYHSVIINTSKEMMCFSDYPIPAHFPNFMHNSFIMEYFRMYADHFQLTKHIRLNTKVLQIKQRADFSRSGQWDVETENKDGKREKHIFDAVMICIGHHCQPNLPLHDFPGINTFKGKYFHSRDYKVPEEWRNKKAVVVGIGNSGIDIAVELSRVTKQLFLSTRRGAWIINRVGENGMPLDLLFNRVVNLFRKVLPFGYFCSLVENRLNKRFDHALYNLKPKHRLFSQHPTVNDDLPNRILSGTIQVKPNIRRFHGSSVEFDDGSVVDDVDLVVFATGYKFSYPFLSSSVMSVSENKASLYKYVFPPELDRPTLAVIGLVQPLGAIMPISEMQARWATRVFKGCLKLPSGAAMLKDIKYKEETMAKRYVTSQRHTIQVDYINYMDEISEMVGVRPRLSRILLTDPQLGLKLLFGPCTPYQYRLRGPGKWAGARQAIFTQWERVVQPMQTRLCNEPKPTRSSMWPLILSAAVVGMLTYQYRNSVSAFLQDPSAFLGKINIHL